MNDDLKLTISTGRSRKDQNWKPQTMKWADLLDRLSSARLVRTAETVEQYQAMSREQRGAAKDKGGFVGGTVRGRRKKANVSDRSLITLDADFATPALLEAWRARGLAGCVYSTHSHTEDAPRLRLMIPLLKPVPAEQYEPIARRVASWVGMDYFDDTTYQATRLMYWPSAPSDGLYVFKAFEGPALDPAEVLGTFEDWKDSRSWPVSSRETKAPRRPGEKSTDPTLKEGWIGAFCRAYNVLDAIEKFIPEAYTPSEIRDRWTYTRGSTPGGLVIYSDFSDYDHAYSWHDTDPASGQNCNAFDLVRIHLFGHLDAAADGPMSGRESFQAMIDLCEHDEAVAAEYLAAQRADFIDPDGGAERKAPSGLISAADLQQMELPPVQWVVEKILPHGQAFLVAPPKSYKSWLVQHLAICVALGVPFLGFKTHRATVLYLALEDSPNRLKTRGEAILESLGGFAPGNLFYNTSASTMKAGLFTELDTFLAGHPDCRLIIIDTFQKVRDGAASRTEGAYQTDYREAGALKAYADSRGLCLLLVHHTNKKDAQGDSVARISGTNGIAGAADTLWGIMRKKRTDNDAVLDITGRDVEAAEYAVEFDKKAMQWKLLGDRSDVTAMEELRRYRQDPIVGTIKDLLEEREGWEGTMAELAVEVESRYEATFSEASLGKALRTLSPVLLKRDSIAHEMGAGRARRTHRLYRAVL